MRSLFLLFAILPIIEIAVLVKIGGVIGGWNTIGLVIVTAFVGAYFVRREGFHTLQTAQQKMHRNEIPGREMLEGLMLVVAGVLLVTPGFITDILGLSLVLPPSRHWLASKIAKHLSMRVVTPSQFTAGQPFTQNRKDEDDDVIEGEYQDKSENGNNQRLK